MKKRYILSIVLVYFLLPFSELKAQQDFSPNAYKEFIEQTKNISAADLLQAHPPKSTYYNARKYPAKLDAIPWFDSINNVFSLSQQEKKLLMHQHFVVSERSEMQYYDWASAFITLYSSDLPLFLSSDFILSTLHNSYDAVLQTLEWQFLEPNLIQLLEAMYDRVPGVAALYQDDDSLALAIRDVDLYLAVALSLAKDGRYLPQLQGSAFYEEIMAAVAAEKMEYLPLFTSGRLRKIDFSQFKPRGHYNEGFYTPEGADTLNHYFQAMMWLGRIDFLLTAPPRNPWETDWTVAELTRMQQGALLLNEVLYSCGKVENLEKHEELISFLVGPDDNLNPAELRSLSEAHLSDIRSLVNEEVYASFAAQLNSSDDYGQKIMSNFFLVDPFTTDPGQLPVSYKLLGQKFLIDSYVCSDVVFDRIIHEGEKVWRPLPDPLDVLAVLGNEDALALLEDELERYHYAPNLTRLQYLVESYDEEFWSQSLYNTWLDAIRCLNPLDAADHLPYFMQTTAWHQLKLNTQLVSWAQLRHDNILYGKPSYTGGTGCSYPFSYVEPYPGLYGKLADFAARARDFFERILDNNEFPDRNRVLDYYKNYGDIMSRLEGIAAKELAHQALDEADLIFLKTMINKYMDSGPSISGWYNDLFFDPDKAVLEDYTVADIHTQPTDEFGKVVGNVLHVGNGKIDIGIFIAENTAKPGSVMMYAGPVSSFHLEVRSDFERLNDQEWGELFKMGNPPGRPDWVASYLTNEHGDAHPNGRALEGFLYLESAIEPVVPDPGPDYLLVFPNPASEMAHLRFVLQSASNLSLEAFDVTGKKVWQQNMGVLQPGEHDVPLPVKTWDQGLYLIRSAFNERYLLNEIIVN